MGICPLSNEPCNNLKTKVVYENNNGVVQRLDLCDRCASNYLDSRLTKNEFEKFFDDQRKEIKEMEQHSSVAQIPNNLKLSKDISNIIEFHSNEKNSYYQKVLSKIKSIFFSFFKKKEPTVIEKLKRLYMKVNLDKNIDLENQDIASAAKKREICISIQRDIKKVDFLTKELNFTTSKKDKNKQKEIQDSIKSIFEVYEELYNELFNI